MDRMKLLMAIAILFPMAALLHLQLAAASRLPQGAKSETVLKADDVGPKLFPDKVFFGGQVATVQLRNAGGIHFSDNSYTLAALVDTAGYSTEMRQKFQGYLLSEVALKIQGHTLPAGAYGVGFLNGGKFVVMDLGAHDVFQADSSRDAEIKRPVPLQVTGTSTAGKYRLYAGRDFVELNRAQ
jgi:hypothetical protein